MPKVIVRRFKDYVRVYPELCGKTLEQLNHFLWLNNEFCEHTDKELACKYAHQLMFELELDLCQQKNRENNS